MRRRIALAVFVAALLFVVVPESPKQTASAFQATFPPASFSTYVPACYDNTNGAVRFVKPWGVKGVVDPNCLPPQDWQLQGQTYDSTACNVGGSFDCRTNEFYTELGLAH